MFWEIFCFRTYGNSVCASGLGLEDDSLTLVVVVVEELFALFEEICETI